MIDFNAVSVIIPAIDETVSLYETVNILLNTCDHNDIEEILIIICDKTTKECLNTIQLIISESQDVPVVLYKQSRPGISSVLFESLKMAKGSHALHIAADMDTDPYVANSMIKAAKKNPEAMVIASRWIEGGGFVGYGKSYKTLNCLFQRMLQVLYRTKVTDLTYGYRLFPVDMLLSITWDNERFPLVLEHNLKVLRLGFTFVEVPAVWRARKEGKSRNSLKVKLGYLKPVFKVRFSRKEKLKSDYFYSKEQYGERQ